MNCCFKPSNSKEGKARISASAYLLDDPFRGDDIIDGNLKAANHSKGGSPHQNQTLHNPTTQIMEGVTHHDIEARPFERCMSATSTAFFSARDESFSSARSGDDTPNHSHPRQSHQTSHAYQSGAENLQQPKQQDGQQQRTRQNHHQVQGIDHHQQQQQLQQQQQNQGEKQVPNEQGVNPLNGHVCIPETLDPAIASNPFPEPSPEKALEGRNTERLKEVSKLLGQFKSCQAVKVLEEVMSSSGETLEIVSSQMMEMHGVDVNNLIQVSQRAHQAVKEASTDHGWQKVSDGDFAMFYQHESWTTTHCFRVRCTLESPVENLVCMAREFDLVQEWNKYCVESTFIKEISLTSVIALATMWMPWPLNNMDIAVQYDAVDMMDDEGVVVFAAFTPEAMPPDAKLPKSWGKNTQVKAVPNTFAIFEPLPATHVGGPLRSRVCISVNIDTGIKALPAFLISFVLKVMAPFMYKQAVQILKKNFNSNEKNTSSFKGSKDKKLATGNQSKHEARMQERTGLYPVIKMHAEELLQGQ